MKTWQPFPLRFPPTTPPGRFTRSVPSMPSPPFHTHSSFRLSFLSEMSEGSSSTLAHAPAPCIKIGWRKGYDPSPRTSAHRPTYGPATRTPLGVTFHQKWPRFQLPRTTSHPKLGTATSGHGMFFCGGRPKLLSLPVQKVSQFNLGLKTGVGFRFAPTWLQSSLAC